MRMSDFCGFGLIFLGYFYPMLYIKHMENIWQNQILNPPKKRNKHNAIRTLYNGRMFDSKWELQVFKQLELAQLGKLIHNLELQPEFPVSIGDKPYCVYTADFRFVDSKNKIRIFDAKGFDDTASKLRRKAAMLYYKINVELIKSLSDIKL